MTSEYRMNQSLNSYENMNFEPGLDQDLAEMMGLNAETGDDAPIGPTFEADEFDLDSFFDDYQPSCRVIHTEPEDLTTESILAECEDWRERYTPEFRGFDDLEEIFGKGADFDKDEDFGRDTDMDPADCIPWEDFLHDIMDMRLIAEENLKLHFRRLEAEAYLELDCTSSDVSWYAGSVLKHLSMMKCAGAILALLPEDRECRRTLDVLNGMEA